MPRTHEKVSPCLRPGGSATRVREALAAITGRWKLDVLFQLFGNPVLRFSQLERGIPGVSQKMLAVRLRELDLPRSTSSLPRWPARCSLPSMQLRSAACARVAALLLGGLAASCAPAAKAPPAAPSPPAETAKADKAFGQVLADYGFVELRPPSTLLPPGTIVRLKSREPLQAGIVCTQRAALGPALDLASSDSKATSLGSLDGAGYALDGNALPFLRVKAQYASVEKVTMRLSNVRVIEIPDSTVYDGLARRSTGCKKALKGLASDPAQTVSMIKSVLVADVSYGVDFRSSANLDAAARLSIVQSLGAELGANSSTATAGSVSGTALYWGATDDVHLVKTQAVPPTPVLHASSRSSYSSRPSPAIAPTPLGDTAVETPQVAQPPVRALTPTSGGLQIDPTPMAAD